MSAAELGKHDKRNFNRRNIIFVVIMCGAGLAFALPAAFAENPSDFELQVAYCLGIFTAINSDVAQDVKHDCASGASPNFSKFCESDRTSLTTATRTAERLRDYLMTRKLTVSDSSIAVALKRGQSDYALTMGADRACIRGPRSACVPVPDDALDRLNRCPKLIKRLPS